jgi:hypothetical protein
MTPLARPLRVGFRRVNDGYATRIAIVASIQILPEAMNRYTFFK